MKNILIKRPYFVLLLPIFFVLHGYTANSKYIDFNNLLPFIAQLLAGSALLYIICRLILKNPSKAGLLVLFCLSFYLFFGALFDFLKEYSPWSFLYKYSVLVIIFLALAFLLFVKLRKMKKDPVTAVLFFNLLFTILIFADLFNLVIAQPWKIAPAQKAISTHSLPHNIVKPDIFFLVFDEYASNRSLKSLYGFDNSQLDNFLIQQGFHLIPNSTSNYPHTYPSMASCLNMEYLKWMQPGATLKKYDYQECRLMIRNNAVVEYLDKIGYEINNQSIFDLSQHPAPVNHHILNVEIKLISEETLLERICTEYDWYLNQFAFFKAVLPVNDFEERIKNNDQCIAGIMKASKEKSNTPRFIYGHFILPHYPVYKDKDGNMLPESVINDLIREKIDPLPYYLGNVQYTNLELRKMVSSIRQNNPEAVIIVISDHGYRSAIAQKNKKHLFYNQNAIYLPSGNYSGFYDSLSNVNQFRVIFNSLFNEQFPLLKDSNILVY